MFRRFKEDTTQLNDIEGLLKGWVKGRVVKHELKPLTTSDENFGSEILRVEIIVEENENQKVIHAVAKLIPPTEMQLEIFNTQVTFKNEIAFYAVIVPLLQDLQREYRLSEIADYFPQLYGARTNLKANDDVVDTDAVILMENLKIEGYTNVDKKQGFDLNTTRQILRILANFQAAAVALKLKKPDVFMSKVLPYLPDFILQVKYHEDIFEQVESTLKENPDMVPLISRLKKVINKRQNKKVREPWATIVHNDLWVNNIMVKFTNNEVTGIKLVDFQVIEYGSIFSDLILFLFTSVQIPVLRYHFHKLILYHYNELVKNLQEFKVDLKEFSYESFLEELRLEIGNQIFHSLFMLSVLFLPKDIPQTPGKLAESSPNQQSNGSSSSSHHESSPQQNRPPKYKWPVECKERVWFITEEAAKQKWI